MSIETGIKIRNIRKQCKLSAKELANKIGLKSAQAILQYERGEREPNIDTLKSIASALQVSINDLIEFEDFIKKDFKDTFNKFIESKNEDILCIAPALQFFADKLLDVTNNEKTLSPYDTIGELLSMMALYCGDIEMYNKDEFTNAIKDIMNYTAYRFNKLEETKK